MQGMNANDNLSEERAAWLRPSILQKGLGLILVPLLLQGLFFFEFYSLNGKTEELARTEARQSQLVEELNKLTELFTWGTIIQETFESNRIGAIDPDDYRRQVDEGLARLKELSPSGNFSQLLTHVIDMSSKQYDLLKEFRQTEPGESSLASFAKYRRLKLTLRPYMHQAKLIDQMIIDERARLNRAQREASEHRDLIKIAIVAGGALDIIITLLLLVFLLKNITDRLAVLVRNARLLPKAEPLPGHVSGSDELAYLDQILHQTSGELQKAAEYRKEVMETMSHDLRSPVQSALITAELLERSQLAREANEESAKTARQIDSLKRNLSRVVGLVEDHLTIDKLESGTAGLEVTSFNLRAAVDEAIDSVLAQANLKSVELINKVEPILVEADRGRIIQVIANYLGNAIKYSPRSAPVSVSSQNLGHSVKVMVTDDGPGMNDDAQSLVYQRFQQNVADGKSRQGFGLGLAICKLLIAHHGGTVGVNSAPGKGSTFWFILPIDFEGE
jgi:signal transduction histidine kinase